MDRKRSKQPNRNNRKRSPSSSSSSEEPPARTRRQKKNIEQNKAKGAQRKRAPKPSSSESSSPSPKKKNAKDGAKKRSRSKSEKEKEQRRRNRKYSSSSSDDQKRKRKNTRTYKEDSDEKPSRAPPRKSSKDNDQKQKIPAKQVRPKKQSPQEKKVVTPKKDTKESAKQSVKKVDKAEEDKPKQSAKKELKVVEMRGSIPVDGSVTLKGYHVLEHKGYTYHATLNQTKVMTNNNKYYIVQALESDAAPHRYTLFRKWGRVGKAGQIMEENMGTNMHNVMNAFYSRVQQKTVRGEYTKIQLNYEADEKDQKKDKKADQDKKDEPVLERAKDFKQSSLPTAVKDLIKLMFDQNMMNTQMKQIGYDPQKMPLGKLSKQTIKKGYSVLTELMKEIQEKNPNEKRIETLNNSFYSLIPHDFGFRKMHNFILRTKKQIDSKLEMLESLENMTVTNKIIQGNDKDVNIIDQNYAKLDRDLQVVEPLSREYQIVEEYLKNTHAKTHSTYALEIESVFRLEKEAESKRYQSEISNKMLLWHGSRLTNYVGILSQGLRIAPPQAPVTGYMFGKGVYFADMVSKSANYCFTNPTNNTGLLLLCEVALGDMNEKFQADYYANLLPPGMHSTKGVGKTYPPTESYLDMDGVKVPIGESKTDSSLASSLLYNQYIVYRISQIKLRYLLRVKFNYKNR